MCTTLTVWWEDLDGKPVAEVKPIVYPSPGLFSAEQPTCTCWIGDEEGEGKTLRTHFVETVLQPMLAQPFTGRIIIEVW